ncbi:hypothetical protein KEM52_005901 [Ascosphaera acerosa]|nr:hypothetical protein KEM52_005901 [Ascosphaera acerosa]
MRACAGCRKRKIKCDAATTNSWPCSACARLKLQCIPPQFVQDSDPAAAVAAPARPPLSLVDANKPEGMGAIVIEPMSQVDRTTTITSSFISPFNGLVGLPSGNGSASTQSHSSAAALNLAGLDYPVYRNGLADSVQSYNGVQNSYANGQIPSQVSMIHAPSASYLSAASQGRDCAAVSRPIDRNSFKQMTALTVVRSGGSGPLLRGPSHSHSVDNLRQSSLSSDSSVPSSQDPGSDVTSNIMMAPPYPSRSMAIAAGPTQSECSASPSVLTAVSSPPPLLAQSSPAEQHQSASVSSIGDISDAFGDLKIDETGIAPYIRQQRNNKDNKPAAGPASILTSIENVSESDKFGQRLNSLARASPPEPEQRSSFLPIPAAFAPQTDISLPEIVLPAGLLASTVTSDGSVVVPPEVLPSEEDALRLFDIFFTDIHPYVPVLHREAWYEAWAHDKASISPLLIEAVLACAARFDRGSTGLQAGLQNSDQSRHAGGIAHGHGHERGTRTGDGAAAGLHEAAKWLALANKHESEFFSEPRLSTVQAMILLLKAREAMPKKGYYYRSWQTLKTIVAMAKDLEMHEHYSLHVAGKACGLSARECLEHTRIWQCLLVLEALIGGSQGRADFGVSLDTVECRPDWVPPGTNAWELQRSRQFTYFMQIAYTIRVSLQRYHQIAKQVDWGADPYYASISSQLDKWIINLPGDLQINLTSKSLPIGPACDDASGSSPPKLPSHFIANMHTYLHLSIISLCRPLLLASKNFSAGGHQVDSLRLAFSKDVTKPFELKENFPFGSPAPSPSPRSHASSGRLPAVGDTMGNTGWDPTKIIDHWDMAFPASGSSIASSESPPSNRNAQPSSEHGDVFPSQLPPQCLSVQRTQQQPFDWISQTEGFAATTDTAMTGRSRGTANLTALGPAAPMPQGRVVPGVPNPYDHAQIHLYRQQGAAHQFTVADRLDHGGGHDVGMISNGITAGFTTGTTAHQRVQYPSELLPIHITAREWQKSVASAFDPHGVKRDWS